MKIEWKQCFKIGVSIFLLYICISYWSSVSYFVTLLLGALSPLIVGCIIAYLINLIMTFYERFYFTGQSDKTWVVKSKRPVCLILAMISMFGVIALLIYMIIPEFISCIELFVDKIPAAVEQFMDSKIFKQVVPKDIAAQLAHLDWQNYIEKAVGFLSSGISGAMNTVATVASSVLSIVITGVIGFIFSIYFLTSKETLISQGKRLLKAYMKPNWYKRTMHYLWIMNDCFHQYIVGKCIDAIILGLMCLAGMLIFGFPYAVMISALIGFTALIPVAGAYIGAGIGAFMIMTSTNPTEALLFIVFIIVLQQIEGNLIYPKVMGSSIGLPGVWVLAAVTVGGSLSGIVGMLIGVPIAATLYKILCEDVKKREDKPHLKKKKKTISTKQQ